MCNLYRVNLLYTFSTIIERSLFLLTASSQGFAVRKSLKNYQGQFLTQAWKIYTRQPQDGWAIKKRVCM